MLMGQSAVQSLEGVLEVLESLEEVLEGDPTGDSVDLLRYFNVHMGNNSKTWRSVIKRNNLPDLNPSGILLLDFCASL